MSLPHASVAVMDGVQFINLTPLDVSPYISKCEIKVFYLGKNRNNSFINEDTATQMAKTLRGNPIVGAYNETKGDFGGHGERVTIDDEGIHFNCDTKPLGFVPLEADIWFQEFKEQDDFGQDVTRKYLMTTGYLWTGQFAEAQQALDEGKPQSMELQDTEGHWAEDSNTGMEYFIISGANISKLCILGDDVEPCFEGASVTAPDVSTHFSKNNDRNFTHTLYKMMQELEFALKGGNTVDKQEKTTTAQATPAPAATEKKFSAAEDNNVQNGTVENQGTVEETSETASEEFKKKEETTDASDKENDAKSEEESKDDDENKDEKKPASKNSLHTDEEFDELSNKFSELNDKFAALEKTNAELIEYKNKIEDKEKDELIAKFNMLDDNDKKDVIENKKNYSLDEIESKLSVIYFRKQQVNFDSTSTKENENVKAEEKTAVTTFNINNSETDNVPDWIKAVEEVQNNI